MMPMADPWVKPISVIDTPTMIGPTTGMKSSTAAAEPDRPRVGQADDRPRRCRRPGPAWIAMMVAPDR